MPSNIPASSEEKVILVMGPTGTGKSSLIKEMSKDANIVVGHKLESQTSEVKASSFVTDRGQKVTIVDTPGFEDSREDISDVDILQMIVDFLQKNKITRKVTGILYLHRISDPRVTKATRKNLTMFRALCGEAALGNVVLITTYWDSVSFSTGEKREEELKSTRDLFKELIDGGARLMRHDRDRASTGEILEHLLPKAPVKLQIIKEIQDGKAIMDTAAGIILTEEIRKLMQKHQAEMDELKAALVDAAKKKDDELRRDLELDKQELQERLDKVLNDQKKLEDEAMQSKRIKEERGGRRQEQNRREDLETGKPKLSSPATTFTSAVGSSDESEALINMEQTTNGDDRGPNSEAREVNKSNASSSGNKGIRYIFGMIARALYRWAVAFRSMMRRIRAN